MKKVVIIFPSEWAAYSPTILGLVHILQPISQVKVIAIDNGRYDNSKLDKKVFSFIRIPSLIAKILGILGLYKTTKFLLLKQAAKDLPADVVIGVDSIGLYTAQNIYRKGHFLSLEIEKDIYFLKSSKGTIESIAIQSQERLSHLFPAIKSTKMYDRCFILPNSPAIAELHENKQFPHRPFRIVFLGNVIPSHGIFLCCEAIARMSDVVLTIKGSMRCSILRKLRTRYDSLLKSGAITIDRSYTPQSDLVDYLSQFDAGFCLYDFNHISRHDFNYTSSPSGKMFSYFCAGVPVIGTNIVGLSPVNRYNAGILIDSCNPNVIREAIAEIKQNTIKYRKGCYNAAHAFDFNRHAIKYAHFLLGQLRAQ